MSDVSGYIEQRAQEIVQQIDRDNYGRAAHASNELQNSLNTILQGARSGTMYGSHQASDAGEPPAIRSGILRGSFTPKPEWHGMSGAACIASNIVYAPFLQDGTRKMSPRPFREKVIEDAMPRVLAIFAEPY